jgi:F-type H+-transporting ATPase subunit delta
MSAVARRYAKALFALAKEAGSLEATADELGKAAAVAADPSLGPVLGSPLLAASKRRALADMLVTDLKLGDLLSRFLHLLADQKRLDQLPSIADHYSRLLDAALGRVRITIRSSAELHPQQQTAIVGKFAQLTGKQILPQVRVDPALLGGVVVEVGGKVYDGSIRTQLDRLAARLSSATPQ